MYLNRENSVIFFFISEDLLVLHVSGWSNLASRTCLSICLWKKKPEHSTKVKIAAMINPCDVLNLFLVNTEEHLHFLSTHSLHPSISIHPSIPTSKFPLTIQTEQPIVPGPLWQHVYRFSSVPLTAGKNKRNHTSTNFKFVLSRENV